MTMLFIGLCFVSYLLGSISFGTIWAKVFNLGNLRQIGSGNTGATNVLRTGNKTAAFLTLLCDGFKGTLAVWLCEIFPDIPDFYGMIFGVCAFIGHIYPVWSKFNGGKGVATYLGVLFGVHITFGMFGCLLWLSAVLFFRISSLGAINMALFTPFLFFKKVSLLSSPLYDFTTFLPFLFYSKNLFFSIPPYGLATSVMSLLLIYKHKDNIKRLLKRTEPKIGQKKQDAS